MCDSGDGLAFESSSIGVLLCSSKEDFPIVTCCIELSYSLSLFCFSIAPCCIKLLTISSGFVFCRKQVVLCL